MEPDPAGALPLPVPVPVPTPRDAARSPTARRAARPLRRARAPVPMATRATRLLQDSVNQSLFAGRLIAHALQHVPPGTDPAQVQRQLEAMRRLQLGAVAELRMLELEQAPEALLDTAMSDLLRHPVDALTGRGGPEVRCAIVRDPRRAGVTGRHVYRIAQEALSNAGRHGGAAHVQVSWSWSAAGPACLLISDDGRGFDPAAIPGGPGLDRIRQYAAALGARLDLRTAPGRGCELRLELQWRN